MTGDTAGGAPLLAVRNLEVVYGGSIRVLRGVSLDVPEGKVVTLGDSALQLLRAVDDNLEDPTRAKALPFFAHATTVSRYLRTQL